MIFRKHSLYIRVLSSRFRQLDPTQYPQFAMILPTKAKIRYDMGRYLISRCKGVESLWTLRVHRATSHSPVSQSIDDQRTDRKRTQILPHGLWKPVQPHMHIRQLLSKRHYLQIILSPAYPQLRNTVHEPMGAAIAYLASPHFEFGPAGRTTPHSRIRGLWIAPQAYPVYEQLSIDAPIRSRAASAFIPYGHSK